MQFSFTQIDAAFQIRRARSRLCSRLRRSASRGDIHAGDIGAGKNRSRVFGLLRLRPAPLPQVNAYKKREFLGLCRGCGAMGASP